MRENEYSLIDAVVFPEFFIAAADHINSVINDRDRRKHNMFRQGTGPFPSFPADIIKKDLITGRLRSVFQSASTEDKNILSDDGYPGPKDGKRQGRGKIPRCSLQDRIFQTPRRNAPCLRWAWAPPIVYSFPSTTATWTPWRASGKGRPKNQPFSAMFTDSRSDRRVGVCYLSPHDISFTPDYAAMYLLTRYGQRSQAFPCVFVRQIKIIIRQERIAPDDKKTLSQAGQCKI